MNKLHLTDEQLTLVQKALDFYSRVGIGQFWVIKEHPSFENFLREKFRKKKGPVEVGDETERGTVVEIGPKRKWIKTKGSWEKGEEIRKWTDVEKVKHSTDYGKYHDRRLIVDTALVYPRNLLIDDMTMPEHGSWGIHNEDAHDTCRMAFDIIQVIRHERWKRNPERSSVTVDSSIHFTHRGDNSSSLIYCELDGENPDADKIRAQIEILSQHIEHPTKPGYKRRDILEKIKQLEKKITAINSAKFGL